MLSSVSWLNSPFSPPMPEMKPWPPCEIGARPRGDPKSNTSRMFKTESHPKIDRRRERFDAMLDAANKIGQDRAALFSRVFSAPSSGGSRDASARPAFEARVSRPARARRVDDISQRDHRASVGMARTGRASRGCRLLSLLVDNDTTGPLFDVFPTDADSFFDRPRLLAVDLSNAGQRRPMGKLSVSARRSGQRDGMAGRFR